MRNRFITLMAAGGLILMSCSGSDSSGDDTVASDVTQPTVEEVSEPDTTESDVAEPDTTEPETTEPETTEPDTTEPDTTEPDTTEPEVGAPAHTFDMIGCEQVAIYQPINATTTQERVPAGVELVVENDQVTSLFVVNECSDTAVDGTPSGAAHVAAQWLPVAGPDEVREGPQFEGAAVLPTAYWEPIYTATDNPMMQELMEAAELDMRLVDSITFDQAAPETTPERYQGHTGWITNADPVVDFGWLTMNPFADAEEMPYGDQQTGFVHVAGDLQLEAVGSIRVADIPGCGLLSGVIDDEGQTVNLPDAPIAGEPGIPATGCFLTTFDTIPFETLD